MLKAKYGASLATSLHRSGTHSSYSPTIATTQQYAACAACSAKFREAYLTMYLGFHILHLAHRTFIFSTRLQVDRADLKGFVHELNETNWGLHRLCPLRTILLRYTYMYT